MSTNKRGSGKQKSLYPKTDKKTAALIHQQYILDYGKLTPLEQKTKNRIPYFYPEDDPSDLWYIDPKKAKGGGFTRLSTKLANNAKGRLNLKNKTPTLEDAIEATGDEALGKNIFKAEKEAVAQKYKGRMDWHDVDHYNSAANPDAVHGSRNLFLQDAIENRSDQIRQVPKFKKDMLGITDRKNYFKLQGPWPNDVMRENIRKGPNNEKEFAEYWYKKVKETVENGNGNGNGNGIKINGKNGKALKIGGGLIAAATLTPTVQAAEQARQEVIAGNYGVAAGTIGKDLVIQQTSGEVAARGLKLASKVISSKLNPIVGKTIARTALKIVGKQVLKKGAALATGPAAPAIVAGMLVFDAYQAADALSGGALTQFFKTKQIKTKNFRQINGRLEGSLNAI